MMSAIAEAATASDRLRAKLQPILAEVAARSELMAEHEGVRQVYVALLRLLYSEVRASVPLLLAAERAALKRAPVDQVAAGIAGWLREHALEEQHHDEWLLEDYAATGGDPGELLRLSGSPTIAAMVGSVYYWTLHAHPVAIPGYCAVLEGSPPSQAFIGQLEERTHYPAQAFHTLRQHSDVDVDHAAEVFNLIDRLPLGAEQEALIGMTALQTADLLIAAADELLEEFSDSSFRAPEPQAGHRRAPP
ncbi:MAG TPA: iron-containing redox enzyme family protein [Chloroflexota bacterium]|jgi:hypothetical protein